MTVGTDIEQVIFLIVTEIMTLKAVGEGGCRSKTDGDANNSGRSGEDSCFIRK